MGVFTPLPAVFRIRWRRRHQEVVEMLGACFAGLPGTDRGTSYEAGALETVEQQKCLSHLLKNLSAVEEGKTGRAKAFTKELKATLREAIKLWRTHRAGNALRSHTGSRDGSSGESSTACGRKARRCIGWRRR